MFMIAPHLLHTLPLLLVLSTLASPALTASANTARTKTARVEAVQVALQDDGDRLLHQGNEHLNQQQFQEALHRFEQALEASRRGGDRPGEARALLAIASIYPNGEGYSLTQVVDLSLEALAIFQQLGDGDGQKTAVETLRREVIEEAEFFGNHALDQDGIESLNQFLPVFREVGDRSGEAQAYNLLSHFYFRLDQFPQGVQAAQQSLAIYQELEDLEAVVMILNQLGERYLWTEQFQPAIHAYENALGIVQERDQPQQEIRILQELSQIYERLGNLQTAIQLQERILEVYQQSNQFVQQGETLLKLASLQEQNRQLEQALERYQQAIAITESYAADEPLQANHYRAASLGVCRSYLERSQIPEALACHQQFLDRVASSAGYAPADLLIEVGNQYLAIAQPQHALTFHQQALRANQDDLAPTDRYNNYLYRLAAVSDLGWAYIDAGYPSEALTLQQQGIELLRYLPPQVAAVCLNDCASVFVQVHGFNILRTLVPLLDDGPYRDRTLALQQQMLVAIQSFNTTNQRLGEEAQAVISEQMGDVYYDAGQYSQAVQAYETSLAFYQTCQSCSVGDRLPHFKKLGDALLAAGDLSQAVSMHQQWIDTLIQWIEAGRGGDVIADDAQAMRDLAGNYWNRGYRDEAHNFFQQTVALEQQWLATGERDVAPITPLDRIQFLNRWGAEYQRHGQAEQALAYYQQALVVIDELQAETGLDPERLDFTGETFAHLGAFWAAANEPELAITFYKSAIDIYEAIRGEMRTDADFVSLMDSDRLFLREHGEDYRVLASLLLEQDRVLEAQEVLDLLKLQELDTYQLDVRGTPETRLGLDFWPAEQAILTLHRQHLRTRPEVPFSALNQPEMTTHIEALRRNARGQNLNPEQLGRLQDNLRQVGNAALLYPLVLDDRLELILVTTTGLERATVPVGRSELNEAIARFRSSITDRRQNPRPQAQELYQWLIAPVAEALDQAGADTLLYAADGPLRYIPLAALYDGEQWLTQRYTINHITAASLTNFSRPEPTSLRLLAGAFPDQPMQVILGDRQVWYDGLPYAKAEVQNLAAEIPDTTTLFSQDFNRSVLATLNQYTVIHFATHAEFQSGSPLDSYILLGDGDPITLADVGQWNLPDVDLVVLSACRTAVSNDNLGNGEEVLGFGYQMQQTGADAAIASLWYVNDGSTQVLMDLLYAAIRNGYSSAEALRRSQIALITGDSTIVDADSNQRDAEVSRNPSSLDHPYYWAPFILIGNGL